MGGVGKIDLKLFEMILYFYRIYSQFKVCVFLFLYCLSIADRIIWITESEKNLNSNLKKTKIKEDRGGMIFFSKDNCGKNLKWATLSSMYWDYFRISMENRLTNRIKGKYECEIVRDSIIKRVVFRIPSKSDQDNFLKN